MISLNHVLAGTAIGLAVRQPALAAPLAFLSHFVLDSLPHFSYKWPGVPFLVIWSIDALASAAAIILLCLASPELAPVIIAGGVAGELPDVFWLYPGSFKSTFWFFRFHKKIQWAETQRGLIYEIGYAAFLIALNLWLITK